MKECYHRFVSREGQSVAVICSGNDGLHPVIFQLDTRVTMDIGATIKDLPINEQNVQKMVEAICKLSADGSSF